MKNRITFRHMRASDALKAQVNEGLERLQRYARNNMEAHVILSVEKSRKNAEVVVTAKRMRAQATASSHDMYVSIEEAMGKVEKTMRRLHDRRVKRKKTIARGVSARRGESPSTPPEA